MWKLKKPEGMKDHEDDSALFPEALFVACTISMSVDAD